MNVRDLQQKLADNAIGKFDKPVEVIDPDGFVSEIVVAYWDDEGDRFVIRTRYVAAEVAIIEG